MAPTPDPKAHDDDEFERAAEQIEDSITSLVGDYEEDDAAVESLESARPQRHLSTAQPVHHRGVICGLYAVIAGMKGDFYAGAVLFLWPWFLTGSMAV